MSAAGLEAALAAAGIPCRVEARAGLAVLVPRGASAQFTEAAARRAALELAVAHGFTHAAVELQDGGDDGAPLPRD